MRIVFLTACLEPGRDGVGDYTRLLAEECERLGHACAIVALSDSYVGKKEETSAGAHILRLPNNSSWSSRFSDLARFTTGFAPDWFSLQFVCFGFHPKGVSPFLAARLKRLIGSSPLQIMFHELWIGSELGALFRNRAMGALQKYFILNLIRKLSPEIINTSNSAYIHLLKEQGISAQLLPLFGALPVQTLPGDHWIFPELQKVGIAITPEKRAEFWLFGMFGTLHPIWPPEPLFAMLREASIKSRRNIVILAIGRIGSGQSLWVSLAKEYEADFCFLNLGERDPQRISEFLNTMDFGIATTPFTIIGKSATAAAMIEHGLPVIVNRDELRFKGFTERPSEARSPLIRINKEFSITLETAARSVHQSALAKVASQFLNSLKTSELPIGCVCSI
ncbi:MAG: glycosyltransferase family 1 protein [Verrucomicrobiales bacterium]|nr:glycosyltransferase family 1 protein [Verrucomicrobiales bacterium]